MIVSDELSLLFAETYGMSEDHKTQYSIEKARHLSKEGPVRLMYPMGEVCNSLLEYQFDGSRRDVHRFSRTATLSTKLSDLSRAFSIGKAAYTSSPPEITDLKAKCDLLIEKHQKDIEDWYFEKQDEVN